MASSPRLGLPYLTVGQANKEVTHNEAIETLDLLVAGVVEGAPVAEPPGSPVVGAAFIVGAGATGAWAGKSNQVAAWTSGGWRFVLPSEGMQLYLRSTGTSAVFRGDSWEFGVVRCASVNVGGVQVVGPRAGAIAAPSGGSVIDTEARAALGAILGALRGHGLIG